MPITLEDLIKNPSLIKKLEPAPLLCCMCQRSITETDKQAEEVQWTSHGPAHDDCYFENLGEIIDVHPIVSVHPRRH